MSEIKWTDSQKKAIGLTDKGAVVSAAAGSGKTAVLIERLTRLLLDETKKIPAENLLAVTFTNDAAAQMRDKLSDAIDKQIAECFADGALASSPKAKWLLEQKSNLQFAVISTINSFCFNFVKDNISHFDFQSGLKILDDTTAKMYFEKARDIALGELCENDEASYELLRDAFDAKDGALESIVKSLYDFVRKLPFREVWINDALKAYTQQDRIDSAIEAYRKSILDRTDRIGRKLDRMNVLIGELSKHSDAKKFNDGYTAIWLDLNDQLADIRKAVENGDKHRFFEAAETKGKYQMPKQTSLNKLKASDPYKYAVVSDLCDQAKDLFGDVKNDIEKLRKNGFLSDDLIRENLSHVAKVFSVLMQVVDSIEYHCHEMKVENNSVDFADVELMTMKLLVENKDGSIVRTPLCEDIRKNGTYKIITIDEFQDVNNLQELIFRALSDGDDLSYMGTNVFIVGDIKQAIYRFRLTNPYLFKKTVEDAKVRTDILELITLQENFRSRQGVIDFANFLFGNILFREIGGVDYDDTHKLRFGADYYPPLGETDRTGNIEVLLMKEHDSFSCDDFSEENLLIAEKIKRMLDPSSGYTVTDPKTKTMRHCRPSDFCILMQKNEQIRQMSKALESVGLKAFSQDVEGYLNATEITLALNILRVIDNPLNDIAMTAVLMSPIFRFTATDMLRIQQERVRKNPTFPGSIYSVISNAHLSYIDKQTEDIRYERVFDDDKPLQGKCSDAFTMIDNFSYRAMSTDLERLIRYIFETTDLIAITSIYLDSDKKRANLLLLMQYAKAYESSGSEGLSGFLRYIDSVSKNEKAFKQAAKITSSGECINIVTYHRSKGLEYPYVFLGELWKDYSDKSSGIVMHFRTTDSKDDVNSFAFETADEKLHIKRTNPYYYMLNEQSHHEDLSEKMRLLYVGCTRAKEKLFLSFSPYHNKKAKLAGAMKKLVDLALAASEVKSTDNLHALIAQGNSMLEWLICGLSCGNCGKEIVDWLTGTESIEDCDEKQMILRNRLTELFCDPSKPAVGADFEFCELDSAETSETTAKTIYAMHDPVLAQKLRNEYNQNGERSVEKLSKAMLPSKLTVTEIVRQENEKLAAKQETGNGERAIRIDPDFFPSLPKLDDNKVAFTAAQRGTFTHKFMELADYDNARESVNVELDRLVEKGFFSPTEAKGVYIDRLKSFFSSDFFDRMSKSDQIMREKQFMVAMKDIAVEEKYRQITGENGIIQGIADCVFKEDDGYVIVDYKTDNFKSADEMDKYGTQLAFYKAALEVVLGNELEDGTIEKAPIKSCYIYSFKLGVGREFVF